VLLAKTRIDQVIFTNGVLQLSWTSPGNAPGKMPFEVESRSIQNGTWAIVTNNASFHYTPDRTFWNCTNPPADSLYRLGLRQLP
jgi:hypothetical protein